MRALPLYLSALILASPALAQIGGGSITGTLELDPARWVVATSGEGSESSWSEESGMTEVVLVGTPEPGSGGDTGTLTITINAQTGAVASRATSANVAFQRLEVRYTAGSENVDLSITAFEAQGDELAIAGSFVATLTPGQPEGLAMDPDDAVTIDGNFQATIPSQD